MRLLRLIVVAAILVFALTAWCGDQPKAPTDSKPATAPAVTNPEFEKIKTLVGTWESKTPDGKAVRNVFRLISAGSAVLVTTDVPDESEMITVIHPDGSDLMLTHYCSAKNQPRFVAVPSSDPNTITFQFKDITNLSSPDAGHMRGVVFKIIDADHHSETWTFRANGKDMTETFNSERVKPQAAPAGK